MIRIGIVLYIIGLTVFYVEATFDRWWWHQIYYIWDKGILVCFLSGIYYLVPNENKYVIRPLVLFSIIRLTWQIIVTLTGWDINDAIVVAVLFIILSIICAYLTIKGVIKWR